MLHSGCMDVVALLVLMYFDDFYLWVSGVPQVCNFLFLQHLANYGISIMPKYANLFKPNISIPVGVSSLRR